MSLLSTLSSLFSNPFMRKKREDEWAKNFSDVKPANPKNNLPLDPGNSSMT